MRSKFNLLTPSLMEYLDNAEVLKWVATVLTAIVMISVALYSLNLKMENQKLREITQAYCNPTYAEM